MTGVGSMRSMTIRLNHNPITATGIRCFQRVFQPGNFPSEYLGIGISFNNGDLMELESLTKNIFSESSPNQIELCLIGTVYSDEIINALTKELMEGSQKQAIVLNLTYGQLTKEGLTNLGSFITSENCPPSLTLELQQSRIGCAGLISILNAVKQSPKLTSLSLCLTNCGISNDGIIALAETLSSSQMSQTDGINTFTQQL